MHGKLQTMPSLTVYCRLLLTILYIKDISNLHLNLSNLIFFPLRLFSSLDAQSAQSKLRLRGGLRHFA